MEKSDVDSDTISTMPVFEASVTSGKTAFMGYSMTLRNIAEKGYKVKDLVLVKLTKNGNVEFKRSVNPADVKDGEFAVTKAINPSKVLGDEDAIEESVQYHITFGIKDNGEYDWDGTEGNVVDPAAIAALKTSGGDNDNNGDGNDNTDNGDTDNNDGGSDNNNGKSSKSSGGCNAGYGLLGLLLAGFVTLKYRKA